jgi:hypothetical protein
MEKEEATQEKLIKEYFIKNEKRDILHAEVVPWLMKEYKKRTKRVFADPDRGIRKLSQQGFLIKIKKGVYRYDPEFVKNNKLEDFSPEVKKAIFERDKYRCVLCGRGIKEGMEIHADHVKAKDLGGEATLENGQTLCSQHNFLKKNLSQTEAGKKFFIRLYRAAKSSGQENLIKFCSEILETFEKNHIDDQIKWTR